MTRALAAITLAFAVSGCSAIFEPCFTEREDAIGKVKSYIGDRKCYNLSEPKVMEGLWSNEFEGSEFAEGAVDPSVFRKERHAFLNDYELLGGPIPPRPNGEIYKVRFVGRKPGLSWSRVVHPGFGHMSMSLELVVVDRFISIEPVLESKLQRSPASPD